MHHLKFKVVDLKFKVCMQVATEVNDAYHRDKFLASPVAPIEDGYVVVTWVHSNERHPPAGVP